MDCHGLRVVLTADDANLLPQLAEQLPPASYRSAGRYGSGAGSPRREIRLRITGPSLRTIEHAGVCIEQPGCACELFDSLERHVDRLVAEQSPEHLGLHAGVVGLDDGALLVVGASGSGKSTLVRSLVGSGARYLSDDLAMLDRTLRAHPYPRPLRDRSGSYVRRLDPAEALAGQVETEPLPVRHVVLTRFREGACFRPSALGGGPAVLALLEHTIPARRMPRRALDRLGRLVRTARVWSGERGDSDETAAAILRLTGP